jgi:hypothetical protein
MSEVMQLELVELGNATDVTKGVFGPLFDSSSDPALRSKPVDCQPLESRTLREQLT